MKPMELIQKLAQAQILQAYGLEKLAKTKFLELAEKGLLSAADKARLGITDKFTAATGKLKNRMVRGLRGRLYGAGTDLAPRQLARNRTLGGMLENAATARHGATISSSPVGPAASMGGNVLIAEDLADQLKAHMPLPKRNARAIGNVRRGLVDHELAEGTMAAGAAHWARQQGAHGAAAGLVPSTASELNDLRDAVRPMSGDLADKVNLLHPGTEHAYEGKPFASHMGPAALVAEAQSTFRDPAASRYMDKVRKLDAGDAYAKQKMKQFGHTPAYPMPLGGKQHFALEEAVANMPDNQIGPQALQIRMNVPGVKIPKGAAAQLEQQIGTIGLLEQQGLIDAASANGMRARMQKTLQDLKKREGARELPYADQQEARRQHMALFAAPRNDANPGRRI